MADFPRGNSLSAGIYVNTKPGTYAIRPDQPNSKGHYPLLSSSNPSSNMAFYSCEDVLTADYKGSTTVSLGYIADLSLPGNCIGVSSLETSGAKVASMKCDIGSPKQNWQFSQNTFWNYWRVDFLGNTKGPYPSGKTQETFPFGKSSPGYNFTIDGDSFSVDYNPHYTSDDGVPPAKSFAFNSAWTVGSN